MFLLSTPFEKRWLSIRACLWKRELAKIAKAVLWRLYYLKVVTFNGRTRVIVTTYSNLNMLLFHDAWENEPSMAVDIEL